MTLEDDPTRARAFAGPPRLGNDPLSPGSKLGHYTIRGRLGAGGMGAVYEATDDSLGRPVAIKVILAGHQHDEGRKRFAREAQAASALNHPNIVTVHEAGLHGDVHFIVMERIAGETLRGTIGPAGLPARLVVHYAAQIASALAAAHDAGIVHRDLKPTNIMVTDRGLVKVVDFGLAKQTLPTTTEVTGPQDRVVGTAQYMSPEQAQGRPVDSRSDVFSFGSVLYEMVTGRPAFKADSAAGTLAAILNGEPAPLAPETGGAPPGAPGLQMPSEESGRALAAHVRREAVAGGHDPGPGVARRGPPRPSRRAAAGAGSDGRSWPRAPAERSSHSRAFGSGPPPARPALARTRTCAWSPRTPDSTPTPPCRATESWWRSPPTAPRKTTSTSGCSKAAAAIPCASPSIPRTTAIRPSPRMAP